MYQKAECGIRRIECIAENAEKDWGVHNAGYGINIAPRIECTECRTQNVHVKCRKQIYVLYGMWSCGVVENAQHRM
jgi:hypothetical protein